MDNGQRLAQLAQLESEARELESKAEEWDAKIADLKARKLTDSLDYRVALIYVKATRKHLHAVRAEVRRLRKLAGLTEAEKRDIRIPTFNHHFYHVAKRLLDEEQFEMIKAEADRAYRLELEQRKIEP